MILTDLWAKRLRRESEADRERLWDECADLSGLSDDAGTVPATASRDKESD